MPVRTRSNALLTCATAAVVLLSTGCGSGTDDASGIVRTTTNIAGAGVVGYDRDTRGLCPAATAADPADGATRHIADADIPADPQRIVVLDTQSLDATCALGLWDRVVGAATLPGSRPQPKYLGFGLVKVPSIGLIGQQPDPARIRALHPDLIIGAITTDKSTLNAVAPTISTGNSDDWQAQFLSTAKALGREEAGKTALDAYHHKARKVGRAVTSGQTQASILRFTDHRIQIQGNDSFAGQVLAETGAQRPPTQRGKSVDLDPAQLEKADGDLIYVLLAGDEGKSYGEQLMDGDSWRDLGAAQDHRVFAVDDAIWNGHALTAANTLLNDIEKTLNGFVTN